MYDFNYLAHTGPDAFWSYLRGLKLTDRVTFPPVFSVIQIDPQSPATSRQGSWRPPCKSRRGRPDKRRNNCLKTGMLLEFTPMRSIYREPHAQSPGWLVRVSPPSGGKLSTLHTGKETKQLPHSHPSDGGQTCLITWCYELSLMKVFAN